jgi:hypothetical protein
MLFSSISRISKNGLALKKYCGPVARLVSRLERGAYGDVRAGCAGVGKLLLYGDCWYSFTRVLRPLGMFGEDAVALRGG